MLENAEIHCHSSNQLNFIVCSGAVLGNGGDAYFNFGNVDLGSVNIQLWFFISLFPGEACDIGHTSVSHFKR